MNTINPTKNPYLKGTENRSTLNNNRNGIISKLFGKKANSPLTQSSNNKSDNKSLNNATTNSRAETSSGRGADNASRTDASTGRGADAAQGESNNQVNTGKANENLAQNSQVQGNTKEGGCGCGGGCAGGCGCGCG